MQQSPWVESLLSLSLSKKNLELPQYFIIMREEWFSESLRIKKEGKNVQSSGNFFPPWAVSRWRQGVYSWGASDKH